MERAGGCRSDIEFEVEIAYYCLALLDYFCIYDMYIHQVKPLLLLLFVPVDAKAGEAVTLKP